MATGPGVQRQEQLRKVLLLPVVQELHDLHQTSKLIILQNLSDRSYMLTNPTLLLLYGSSSSQLPNVVGAHLVNLGRQHAGEVRVLYDRVQLAVQRAERHVIHRRLLGRPQAGQVAVWMVVPVRQLPYLH